MSRWRLSRRSFLRGLGGSAMAWPLSHLVGGRAAAMGQARRFIVFYFPDGIAGASENGDPSQWHCQGSENDFRLGELLTPLEAFRDDCVEQLLGFGTQGFGSCEVGLCLFGITLDFFPQVQGELFGLFGAGRIVGSFLNRLLRFGNLGLPRIKSGRHDSHGQIAIGQHTDGFS